MKIRRRCQEVTTLVLQGQDRPLLLAERASLRLHWLVCIGCRRFRKQADLMQRSLQRWRGYRETDELDRQDSPAPDPID
jgi:hypothetical protein